jgi:hypothetical protein
MAIDVVFDANVAEFTLFPVRPDNSPFGILILVESGSSNCIRMRGFGRRDPWTLSIEDATRAHTISTKTSTFGNEEILCAANISSNSAQLIFRTTDSAE